MSEKHVSDKVLTAGMVFSMIMWGLSWTSGKILTHYCSAINFAILRYIIVVASMCVILLAMKIRFKVSKTGFFSIIISGILLAAYTYFFFTGLMKGSAGAGGVLVTTLNPIMAYFLGIVLSKKPPSRNEAIGLFLGVLAAIFLLQLWNKPQTIYESGNLYFLLAAVIWAVMSKFTSKGHLHGSSLSFSLWQYVVTFLCILPLINVQEFTQILQVRDSLFWWNLLFSSVFATSIATTVFFYTTTRLGAEKASSFIFLVPFAAALSSWAFLGEQLMPHTAIGGLLGIGAVYVINRKRR